MITCSTRTHTATSARSASASGCGERLLTGGAAAVGRCTHLVALARQIDRRELLGVVLLERRGGAGLQQAVVVDEHTDVCSDATPSVRATPLCTA